MSGEMARLAERRTAAETELNDTNSKLWEEYQLTESEARSQCVPFESLTELRRSVTEVRGKIRAWATSTSARSTNIKRSGSAMTS